MTAANEIDVEICVMNWLATFMLIICTLKSGLNDIMPWLILLSQRYTKKSFDVAARIKSSKI